MATKKTTEKNLVPVNYADFVIVAKRINTKSIEVSVKSSPAGTTAKPVEVSFTTAEAKKIHDSFCFNPVTNEPGKMLITQQEATELGKKMTSVMLPFPVSKIFAESLGMIVQKTGGALRVRLSLDDVLNDLPWEYMYRPDRIKEKGMSGFLLLDPAVSIVREKANPAISLNPISGKQELTFIGTLWEGNNDAWEVKKEFEGIKNGLVPVSKYISAKYLTNPNWASEKNLVNNTAIFHYSGHCDFDKSGKAYMVPEVPKSGQIELCKKVFTDNVADKFNPDKTRLIVLSACNSGFSAVVKPFLQKGIPALIGINGIVSSQSTIEFCAKLYESLAIGLTLDEAVNHARMHLMEWGAKYNPVLFDWGLYMVYMPSPQAVIFPRKLTSETATIQKKIRSEHSSKITSTLEFAEKIDGLDFGQIMSVLTKRQVLILGRFTNRRLEILEEIKAYLKSHPNKYIPQLFTFEKPDNRDLVESIIGFAAFSKFILADISEPKSIPSELQAIVPNFLSVPVATIINSTGKPYATYSSIERKENVIKPIVRYKDTNDLLKKLDELIMKAEDKLSELRPA